MKKVKYIALVLILMLGLIGGAYAYWQDQVVVSGTVDTGHMDVGWTYFVIRNAGQSDPFNPPDAQHLPAYVEAFAYIESGNPKKAIITISNLYPSISGPERERVAVEGHMRNNSSIPVKFDEAVLTLNKDDNSVSEWMRVDLHLGTMWNPSGAGWKKITPHPTAVNTTLNELDNTINFWLDDLVLQPGQYLTFGDETLYFYLDSTAPNSVQNSELEFTLELKFKQWNAP